MLSLLLTSTYVDEELYLHHIIETSDPEAQDGGMECENLEHFFVGKNINFYFFISK